MKRILSYSAVIISLGLTASSAFAQTTANGPYYATPSWDQTLPVSTRFIVLSNMNSEAVLDRETGLVWERSPRADTGSWELMGARCNSRPTGGRYGWRLPTVQEFASLIDPAATSLPPLPVGHPFIGVPTSAFYWTANLSASNPNSAHEILWISSPRPAVVVSFQTATKTIEDRAWCVRGGIQPAPQ